MPIRLVGQQILVICQNHLEFSGQRSITKIREVFENFKKCKPPFLLCYSNYFEIAKTKIPSEK